MKGEISQCIWRACYSEATASIDISIVTGEKEEKQVLREKGGGEKTQNLKRYISSVHFYFQQVRKGSQTHCEREKGSGASRPALLYFPRVKPFWKFMAHFLSSNFKVEKKIHLKIVKLNR